MEADVTLSAQFWKWWTWVENNKKQVGWAVAGVAAMAVAVSYYLYSQGQVKIQAGDKLSVVATEVAFGQKSPQDAADAYLRVAAQNAGTDAAAIALVQAGVALFTTGDYDKAQTQFKRLVAEHAGSPLMPQALLGIAACLDATGKAEEAAQAYKSVVDRFPNSSATPQAKFALARILESQGQYAQAFSLYENLIQMLGGNSSIGSEAGVRAMEIRSKLPASVTSPVPTTPAAADVPSEAANPGLVLTNTL